MRYFTIGLLAASLMLVGCSKKPKHKHDSKSGHDHSMKAEKAMGGEHMGHDHSMHAMGDAHKGHDHSMHAMGDAHKGHDHSMHAMAGGAKVTVPKEGKKFKPPIKAAQLPAGVWYCDMGTVHYARGEKGDGKCPLCKMNLKQLAAK